MYSSVQNQKYDCITNLNKMDNSGLGVNLLSSPFKTIDPKMNYGYNDRSRHVSTHLKDLLDMTRRNLDGLNSTMNKSREREYDEIPHNKVNMYKFLEYNRPPTTSSFRVRLRDNYSVDGGTPIKEYIPTFDSLPPKSPTPPPPHLRMTGGNEFTQQEINQSVSHNLAIMAQNLQDKIELEFKSQMHASKEELLFMQKEMTDKFRNDLKRASECADDLHKLEDKFTEFKNEILQTLHTLSKDVEYLRAENKEIRNELKENKTINEELFQGDKERNEGLRERVGILENAIPQKLTSLEQKLDRNLKTEIEETENRLKEMQERLTSDSKNQDMSLKSIVTALEDQSTAMAKLKKELAKIMDKMNEEKFDQIKTEISQEYNQKFKRIEAKISDDNMQAINSQNDIMKKLNKLSQQVQEVDEKGNKKSSRVASVIDPDIEPRLERKIDTKCDTLNQKIKSLEIRIDDITEQLTKINNESVVNTSQLNSQSNKKASKRKKGVLEDIEEIECIEPVKSKIEETKKKEIEPAKSTTVTKIEENKPTQSISNQKEKAQEIKADVVEKFEMPIDEMKIPQKQEKTQNFMDALDSSFGDSHSESDGFESSKGGVNYYDFGNKPTNTQQTINTNQKETELDKKLKVLREDQKAFLINSIVNDEILSSIESHRQTKETIDRSQKSKPSTKPNKFDEEKKNAAPKQSKAFEYKGIDDEEKRPNTKGVGLGAWDIDDNYDESENSDFNQSADIKIAKDQNPWGPSNKKKPEQKVQSKGRNVKMNDPKMMQNRRDIQYDSHNISNDKDDQDDDDDWGSFDLP